MNDESTNSERSTDPASPATDAWHRDVVNGLKGIAMGICDAVPGVSGGTVALIVGIYDRIFRAISRFNRQWIGLIANGRIAEAFRHVDGRFLLALLIGIGLGYVAMSKAIKILMASDTLRVVTLSSFAGMILGSLWIVFRMVECRTRRQLAISLLAAMIGGAVSSFIAMQAFGNAESDLLYLFFCAVIAICAMILPGISGAMILLILGVYYSVLEIPGNLLKFQDVGINLLRLVVFLSGCVVGLLLFARLIRNLLSRFRMPTLATMGGLMLGSLVILWPFQNRIEPEVTHHKPTYEMFLPAEFNVQVGLSVVCIVVFSSMIIAVDRWARKTSTEVDQWRTRE